MSLRRRIVAMRRHLSFTREGRIFVAVTIGVGFAAINTSNNLLFLMLSMMLSLIISSGILSEIAISRLLVRRRVPHRARCGEVFPVELQLSNRKRWQVSFSVELRDRIDGVDFKRSCYFLRTAPLETRGIAYRCEIERRGEVRFEGVRISTRFPFGLFEKSRFVPLAQSLLIWPALLDADIPALYPAAADGACRPKGRGMGGEFWQLREFVNADDPRLISWKASARTGTLVVRETREETCDRADIVLDAASFTRQAARGEEALSLCATAVQALLQRGSEVTVLCGDAIRRETAFGSGASIMDFLARLDLSQPPAGRVPAAGQGAFYIGDGPVPAGAYPLALKGGAP